MSDLYRENIIDHYKNPRFTEEITKITHKGSSQNLSCGDETAISLVIDPDTSVIKGISHKTTGCALCVASVSILAENIIGKTLKEAQLIDPNKLNNLLGVELSFSRQKCANVSIDAVSNIVKV